MPRITLTLCLALLATVTTVAHVAYTLATGTGHGSCLLCGLMAGGCWAMAE